MNRPAFLSRADIRQVHDRAAGALTLKYVGRKLRFFDHLYGYPLGVFFAVSISEVPLPENLVTLASAVGVDLYSHSHAAELREAVAEVLASEALVQAPDYLSMCAEPHAVWTDVDGREMEHRKLVAENRVRDLSRIIETSLRRRAAHQPVHVAPVHTYAAMPPAGFVYQRPAPPPPVAVAPPEPVEVEEELVEVGPVASGPLETSEAAGRRVLASVRLAREQELPQRLPGGARRSLARSPAGIYLSHGASLERMRDICSAMVAGAEGGKRGGDVAILDWDGEWPVVARRYGAHGRIVYRVEDALKRHGIAAGDAA